MVLQIIYIDNHSAHVSQMKPTVHILRESFIFWEILFSLSKTDRQNLVLYTANHTLKGSLLCLDRPAPLHLHVAPAGYFKKGPGDGDVRCHTVLCVLSDILTMFYKTGEYGEKKPSGSQEVPLNLLDKLSYRPTVTSFCRTLLIKL